MIAGNRISARLAMERVLGADKLSDAVAGYGIPGASAEVAVSPGDVPELGELLAESNSLGLAVAPIGGGTRTELGNVISRLDVVADLTRLNAVIEHNPADLTCTVQAGIRVSELRRALSRQGQFLAMDPPLPERATVGGTLATAAGGPMKPQFGNLRDVVIGMKVVQADGKTVKSGGQVVKNVSGYDMARLHVGGLGTLGVIVEVSFKLAPLPAAETTLVASFGSHDRAVEAGLGIMHSGMTPLALTSFDEMANATSGLLPPSQGHLAIRLGGRPRTLKRMTDDSSSISRSAGARSVEALDEATAASLWRGLADFGWDDGPTPAMAGRVSVLPANVARLVESIKAEAVFNGLRTAVLCHPGYGTVTVLWFAAERAVREDVARYTLVRARDISHTMGGRMSIDRCPIDVRRKIDVWDDVGDSLAVMRRLKSQFDPKSTLNPGRFVAGI